MAVKSHETRPLYGKRLRIAMIVLLSVIISFNLVTLGLAIYGVILASDGDYAYDYSISPAAGFLVRAYIPLLFCIASIGEMILLLQSNLRPLHIVACSSVAIPSWTLSAFSWTRYVGPFPLALACGGALFVLYSIYLIFGCIALHKQRKARKMLARKNLEDGVLEHSEINVRVLSMDHMRDFAPAYSTPSPTAQSFDTNTLENRSSCGMNKFEFEETETRLS